MAMIKAKEATKAAPLDREAVIDECARCVPTNWLDPILSGPDKVGDLPGRQTEELLRRIQDRIRALKSETAA